MANRNLDEYQPKRFYTQNTKARENGFAKFEKDGAYYFALYQHGEIVMLSQAYKGIAGRDNGIESVKKNRRIAKRYRFDNRSGGKYGFGLYAGNGQEIAISANLNSRAEAERVAGRLNGSVKSAAKPKAAPKKPVKKKAAPKRKVAAKAAPKKRAANDEDNYQRLAFYQKHTKGRKNGIEKFKGDDGEYYFAHFENGKIRLISESYPTTTARDTGAASVEKNIKLEKRYDYRGPLKNGKYEYRLKAGNGKEIARSIWYGSAATAATGAAYLMGTRKRSRPKPKAKPRVAKAAPIVAAAALAPKVVKPKPKPKVVEPPKPVVKKVVPPKPVAPTPPPVAKAAAPIVAAAAAAPIVAAKAAAPVAAAPAAAASAATGGGLGFLKWLIPLLLLLLLALFGLKNCKPTPPAPVVVPAVSCWDGSEAENRSACPTKVTCWDGSHVKNASACPAEPAPTFTCWDGSEVEALSSCPAEPAPEPEPAPAPEPAPEPVTTYAEPTSGNFTRICGPSSNVLFDVPNYSPKTVAYLGSNPQYGNSHGLTSGQFYAKLVAAHQSGGMDQAFLNLMARSLGYSHFRDMSAADFTEDTLPNGSKGLLGFSTAHVLQYSKIQTDDPRHLEAFRVRSLNGTDVHIMKTCGNYMYVCN